ncbi:LuxR family transcriptional regulator [Francisella sp. Scap27]|uniref:helix-turn-helix transcriptional regulator n=1 Tax=Francisella sp. Scap27 TaxID=2589986 RepID=UPI0015B7EE97|nr:LuxR C-terminal-related transcriptional regulator [Francisella sp. Scap27]QLE79927.1 LuxR family transcriptional regulator [Francisella sp. Scap27]
MHIIKSWDELDFEATPFLNNADVINKIIEPISHHFGLDCFSYHKTFSDGSQIRLSNRVDWYKHYLSEKLYLESVFELSADNYQSSYFLWSTISSHERIIKEAAKHGIYQGVTIVNKISSDCEFYFLGMSNSNQILYRNLVLNINQLLKFVSYFNVKAKNIIQTISMNKIISEDMRLNSTSFESVSSFNKVDYVMDLYDINMTNREKDISLQLINNKTSKQIALSLGLSYRTVEQYIDNLKNKFGVFSKQDLESKLREMFA